MKNASVPDGALGRHESAFAVLIEDTGDRAVGQLFWKLRLEGSGVAAQIVQHRTIREKCRATVVAAAGNEHLVQSHTCRVGRCEAVPRISREKLSRGRLRGTRTDGRGEDRRAATGRWNRKDARLHADGTEIGTRSLRRIAAGAGTNRAVPAGLAGIEDQLSEPDAQAEAALGLRRGHEVGDLPPLVRSECDER